MTSATARAPLGGEGWLYGRWRDLLFGCGLLYAAVFLGLLGFGRELRLAQPEVLFALAFLAISIPHYGATLLRVYERARDRRAYALFSVWATLLLAAVFAGSLFSPALGTLFVTVYFTWSPWHYTGQNYGIAVMFLRRRGVAIEGAEKRWLYASFVLSFLLVAIVSHGGGVGVRSADQYDGSTGIAFAPLGIPLAWVSVLAPLVAALQLVALAQSARQLSRRASLRTLAPVLALWLAQSLWFTLPYAALHFGWFGSVDALSGIHNNYYFMWVALAHAAQYMWVSAYYARQSGAQPSVPVFWAKATAAGAVVWTLPVLAFWQPGLALLSPDSGVLLLVSAFANLHHFVLDGAIWKLRGRIAQVLIQSQPEVADAAAPARRWPRRLIWASCGALLLANAAGVVIEARWISALQRRDLAGAQQSLELLHWLGRDRGSYHLVLASGMLQVGAFEGARKEAQRALADGGSLEAHAALARALVGLGEHSEAARTLEAASALAPQRVDLAVNASRAWRAAGDRQRGLALLERAAALAPHDAELARELARVRRTVHSTHRSAAP